MKPESLNRLRQIATDRNIKTDTICTKSLVLLCREALAAIEIATAENASLLQRLRDTLGGSVKEFDLLLAAERLTAATNRRLELQNAQLTRQCNDLKEACKLLFMCSLPIDVSGQTMIAKARQIYESTTHTNDKTAGEE